MIKLSLPLSLAISIMTLTIGIGVGAYLAPAYAGPEKSMNVNESASEQVEAAYFDAQITQSKIAIGLARQVRETHRPELHEFAANIIRAETQRVADILVLKRDWFDDTQQVREPKIPDLGTDEDGAFDVRYLDALIAHQEATLAIVQSVASSPVRAKVRQDARALEEALARDLVTLRSWRNDWFNG